MQYTVSSTNSRHFEVTDDNGTLTGALDYAIWLPSRAHITTAAGIVYEIAPTGFWQTTKLITRDGIAFAELKPDYNRGIYLSFENGLVLYFKRRSFWVNNEYMLTDTDGNEIAAVRSFFEWSNFSFSYTVDISEMASDREVNIVLPMVLLYCARFMRMRNAA